MLELKIIVWQEVKITSDYAGRVFNLEQTLQSHVIDPDNERSAEQVGSELPQCKDQSQGPRPRGEKHRGFTPVVTGIGWRTPTHGRCRLALAGSTTCSRSININQNVALLPVYTQHRSCHQGVFKVLKGLKSAFIWLYFLIFPQHFCQGFNPCSKALNKLPVVT